MPRTKPIKASTFQAKLTSATIIVLWELKDLNNFDNCDDNFNYKLY